MSAAMTPLNNTFWKRTYCDGNGYPSSNRVHMGVIAWPIGFFITALAIITLIKQAVPVVPTSTVAFFSVVSGIFGIVRGIQTYQENKVQTSVSTTAPAAS